MSELGYCETPLRSGDELRKAYRSLDRAKMHLRSIALFAENGLDAVRRTRMDIHTVVRMLEAIQKCAHESVD